jgi:molybdopterin converting factor small subunit
MITVALPSALQPYARGSSEVALEERCSTVGDALTALASRWPGVVDRVVDERGLLRPHVNVFVGEESVRCLRGLETPLAGDCTITIVPAVSGG